MLKLQIITCKQPLYTRNTPYRKLEKKKHIEAYYLSLRADTDILLDQYKYVVALNLSAYTHCLPLHSYYRSFLAPLPIIS